MGNGRGDLFIPLARAVGLWSGTRLRPAAGWRGRVSAAPRFGCCLVGRRGRRGTEDRFFGGGRPLQGGGDLILLI